MSTSPSTVTEAVALLREQGYTTDLGLRGNTPHSEHDPDQFAIEEVFRFEGDSDPGDEMIVLGVYCPDCDARGTVVSAYGHGADPALFARLRRHPA